MCSQQLHRISRELVSVLRPNASDDELTQPTDTKLKECGIAGETSHIVLRHNNTKQNALNCPTYRATWRHLELQSISDGTRFLIYSARDLLPLLLGFILRFRMFAHPPLVWNSSCCSAQQPEPFSHGLVGPRRITVNMPHATQPRSPTRRCDHPTQAAQPGPAPLMDEGGRPTSLAGAQA